MSDFRFHFAADVMLFENGNENGNTLVFKAFVLQTIPFSSPVQSLDWTA